MKIIKIFYILLSLNLITSCATKLPLRSNASASTLITPWEIENYSPGPAANLFIPKACPAILPAVKDLNVPMFYSDAKHSIIDPILKKQYDDGSRVIRNFVRSLSYSSSTYLYSKDRASVECAISWLMTWAQGEAMLGAMALDPQDKMSIMQGKFVRKWTLASIAESFLKIRSSDLISDSQKYLITNWIKRLSDEVKKDYYNPKLESNRNNHAYWAGLSEMLSAIVLNDNDLFLWSLEKYKLGVDQIQDNGVLPLEIARGAEALHYHYFSIEPLLLMAEFAKSNGVDLYGYKENRINLLINLLAPTLSNPDSFSPLMSGVTPAKVFIETYGWAELAYNYSLNQDYLLFLHNYRTTYSNGQLLSGQLLDNFTALFGNNN